MARPTETSTSSSVRWLEVYRRGLERSMGYRVGCVLTLGGIGGAFLFLPSFPISIVGAVCTVLALAHLILPLSPPERARKKMLVGARATLPEADGVVTLIGVACESGPLLGAWFSHRPCIAFWARTVRPDSDDHREDNPFDDENWAGICDFALDVGSEWVFVEGAHAYFAFDRSHAEVVLGDETTTCVPATTAHRATYRREEVILRPGDRVAVRGMLVSEGRDTPFRRSFRMTSGPHQRVMVAAAGDGAGEQKLL